MGSGEKIDRDRKSGKEETQGLNAFDGGRQYGQTGELVYSYL